MTTPQPVATSAVYRINFADGSMVEYRTERPYDIEARTELCDLPPIAGDPFAFSPGRFTCVRVTVTFTASPNREHPVTVERTHPGTDAEAVLTAFAKATGWSYEQAAHYASCDACKPICGMEEEDCPDSPATKALRARIARARGSVGHTS